MDKNIERMLEQPSRAQDVRSEYDRDEARLIHSAAFRRLQSKTQVLGLGESDFYRTRLTHSMEVAQIGRGIVKYLENKCEDRFKDYLPDMALISAICLAHDIGHPPFGHGGEVALNYCMREYGGFEGNGQTLRILGKLDKYTEKYGLNPTRRMLLGVLKYPMSYNELVNSKAYNFKINPESPYWLFEANKQKPPKCYHSDDQDIVDFIMKGFDSEDFAKFKVPAKPTEELEKDRNGSFIKDDKGEYVKVERHKKSLYKSLDCSIMNLADNISYSLHDLEDALSLGMISKSDWEKHFKNMMNLFEDVGLNYDEITMKIFGEGYQRKAAIGSLVNMMITNVTICDNGSGCDDFLLKYEVKLKDKVESFREHIFKLVLEKVIMDENVQQLEFKGQKLIIELFQVLATDPKRFLPKTTLRRWDEVDKKQSDDDYEKARMRVICDFISGMTDDYATRFYEKIFTPSKGSIFERL